jgi:hypothetical protein
MSAATITSYGGNGQKDVCFIPWKPMRISVACNGLLGRLSVSFRGEVMLIAALPNQRLQAGVSERLAEQERPRSWVVLCQSPMPQPYYVARLFLSVGSCKASYGLREHSQ